MAVEEGPEAATDKTVASGSQLAVSLKKKPTVTAAPGAVLSKLFDGAGEKVDSFAQTPKDAYDYGVELIQASLRADKQLEELNRMELSKLAERAEWGDRS
ncbi:hypothetical protein [Terrihabitans soli]|uniref:hypothetical protein n=1 Tax=Terrihabitans soli TaxID=708113 RepID=UPI001CA3733B|nr:hypothetical protein [Terrihabitans soli]